MSASDAGSPSTNTIGAEAIDGIARSLTLPRGFEPASTLQTGFVAAMIGEGRRELTELIAMAREDVADAAAPPNRSAA